MQLAKPAVDIGLYTNRYDEARRFYVDQLGLPYDELLKAGRGVHQHRLRLHGAVLKLNDSRDPLPDAPTGYRALTIASDGGPATWQDPDGLPVTTVAPGDGGIDATAVTVASADPDAHERFYVECLGAERAGDRRYRLGETLVVVQPDATVERAGPLRSRGFRYLTVQVFDVVEEHTRLVGLGVEEGTAPVKLGDVAAISFIRDPGGNWIEISQRASLTGPLPDRL